MFHFGFVRPTGRAAAAVLLAATMLTGCQRGSTEPLAARVLDEPYFIRGSITQVGGPWGYIVTGQPGTSYKVDKAAFRTTDNTEFIRSDGTTASAADLTLGRNITLWITGIIMESYPVQVSATRVLID